MHECKDTVKQLQFVGVRRAQYLHKQRKRQLCLRMIKRPVGTFLYSRNYEQLNRSSIFSKYCAIVRISAKRPEIPHKKKLYRQKSIVLHFFLSNFALIYNYCCTKKKSSFIRQTFIHRISIFKGPSNPI